MDNNTLNTRKIYIDTRYKRDQYGSNTDFEINLPQTVECPDNTVMYVDEIVLPNTLTTIQKDVNDKLYFGVFYNNNVVWKTITFTEQSYTLSYFANQLKTLMNLELNNNEAEFVVNYNNDKLTISISLKDKRFIKVDPMTWQIFTDDNLRQGYFNATPITDPQTCNENLQNFVINPLATWHYVDFVIDYNIDLHTTRNLYLLADIGAYHTTTNFPWSGSTVIKEIQMTVPFNETLFSNVIMPYDASDVSGQSFNRIKFRLVNSKGQQPKLTSNWSFSLIFTQQ